MGTPASNSPSFPLGRWVTAWLHMVVPVLLTVRQMGAWSGEQRAEEHPQPDGTESRCSRSCSRDHPPTGETREHAPVQTDSKTPAQMHDMEPTATRRERLGEVEGLLTTDR
jgi:hypothetical protein